MDVEIIPFTKMSEGLFNKICASLPEAECFWLHEMEPIELLRGLQERKRDWYCAVVSDEEVLGYFGWAVRSSSNAGNVLFTDTFIVQERRGTFVFDAIKHLQIRVAEAVGCVCISTIRIDNLASLRAFEKRFCSVVEESIEWNGFTENLFYVYCPPGLSDLAAPGRHIHLDSNTDQWNESQVEIAVSGLRPILASNDENAHFK